MSEGIEITRHAINLKKGFIDTPKGKEPYGPLFIDLPTRFVMDKVGEDTKLIIESELSFDGISLRKLNLDEVRNGIQYSEDADKHNIKASSNDGDSLAKKVSGKVIFGTLKQFGVESISEILGIFKTISPHDSKGSFNASIYSASRRLVGKGKYNSRKYNGGKGELPKIKSNAEISLLENDKKGILTHRLNIPIDKLSRDHNKDVVVTLKQKVKVILKGEEVATLDLDPKELKLGGIWYDNLASTKNSEYQL